MKIFPWMLSVCALILVVFLFVGGGVFSGRYIGPVLIGACIATHLWMMLRGHGRHVPDHRLPEKNEQKHGGCCH